jgi:DNA-binding response OmpR family regulator
MSKKPLIWILEDEPGLLFFYEECFRDLYDVRTLATLVAFREAMASVEAKTTEIPDLIIADLTLPDGCFLEVIPVPFPLIVASSNADLTTLRTAFVAGAVDYLVKPFGRAELLAKTEMLLNKLPDPVLAQLDEEFTRKEEQILDILKRAGTRGVHRQELIQLVWKNTHVTPKTLDVHVFHLRKKLNTVGYQVKFQSDGHFVLHYERPHE